MSIYIYIWRFIGEPYNIALLLSHKTGVYWVSVSVSDGNLGCLAFTTSARGGPKALPKPETDIDRDTARARDRGRTRVRD